MIADTSRDAHKFIKPHAPCIRERVFQFIASRGFAGATIEEIHYALGIKESTVCGRVNDLHDPKPDRRGIKEKARIRNSERTRETRSGHSATVWISCVDAVQTALFI